MKQANSLCNSKNTDFLTTLLTKHTVQLLWGDNYGELCSNNWANSELSRCFIYNVTALPQSFRPQLYVKIASYIDTGDKQQGETAADGFPKKHHLWQVVHTPHK